MQILFFLIHHLCTVSYKFTKITKDTDTSKYQYLGKKDKVKFYIERQSEKLNSVPLPQQIDKLKNLSIKIEKNNNVYVINPLKHFKVVINDTTCQNLGEFDRMKFTNNSIVCYYKNGDVCDKSKIMFVMDEGEPKIEKYFSGVASYLVFKVTGPFLGEKCELKIIYYLKENEEKINLEVEDTIPSFINYLKQSYASNKDK